MTSQRFSRLQELLKANGFSATVINPGSTLTYLTGLHFHLMERPTLLICREGRQPVLVLPELELGKTSSSTIPLTPVTFGDDPSTWPAMMQQALKSLELERGEIAVEPTRLRFMEIDYLKKAAPGLEFVNGESVFSTLRIQKDAGEIQSMRKAVEDCPGCSHRHPALHSCGSHRIRGRFAPDDRTAKGWVCQ